MDDRHRFKGPLHAVTSLHVDAQWLKRLLQNVRDFITATWLDWLTILIIGAVAAGAAPHTFERLFPVTAPDGAIYWPELAHPYVKPIFSPAGAGALCAVLPLYTFALAQVWQRSFTDYASAVLGLSYSMVTGTCIQVILKKTVGGLRPHFLAVCQPVLPPANGSSGIGFQMSMYTAKQVCTGDPHRIQNALESFPSGHAEVAFAGLGYLAIYLFTHLGITSRSRKRGSHWRMLCIVAPLLLATYLSSTLVLGYHHHDYDVIAGALIGWFTAFLGYRMVFMGVFDARWNTVPYLKLRGDEEGRTTGSKATGGPEGAAQPGEQSSHDGFADGRPLDV